MIEIIVYEKHRRVAEAESKSLGGALLAAKTLWDDQIDEGAEPRSLRAIINLPKGSIVWVGRRPQ